MTAKPTDGNRANSGFGDHGRNLNEDGEKDDDHDRGDKGEVGGGHFEKGPWLSVCSAVDAPIPEQGASDTEGEYLLLFFRYDTICCSKSIHVVTFLP